MDDGVCFSLSGSLRKTRVMSGDTEFALIMAVEAFIGCSAIGAIVFAWPAIRAKVRQERELKEQYGAERQRLKQEKLIARRGQGSATA